MTDLSLEISCSSQGILVHQTKYTIDILQRFGMLGAKSCATPIALVADANTGPSFSVDNAKNYKALIGALPYLTFCRPDILFSVSKLSQFMHHPSDSHLTAAKRVLRYLAGTLNCGPNPIFWGAKKQTTVSRSSTEAEYRALASTTAELSWIR
ncbi:uncharacterized protein LOC111019428 [Momordica charantia]|uniref:Uncharacterized protein LOC111019428 n=1 Tax=Momordica charantia TaxID=3673 RepID=A0A6J1DCC6_MOMCH|nr:uncharacterized protein LOC111019428 [Momordica charantia]